MSVKECNNQITLKCITVGVGKADVYCLFLLITTLLIKLNSNCDVKRNLSSLISAEEMTSCVYWFSLCKVSRLTLRHSYVTKAEL